MKAMLSMLWSSGFVDWLTNYKWLILILHILGFAIGLGAVTVADVLFFKFLRDFKISAFEANILRTLSRIVWFSIIVIIISGTGLYLPQMEILNQSGKFLAKMAIVSVIILNGIFLNVVVSPKLLRISFDGKRKNKEMGLGRIRKLSYASGAISLVSWYYASILGIAENPTLGFAGLIVVYLFLASSSVFISQLFEHSFYRK